MLPATAASPSLRPTGRLGSEPAPAWEKLTGPLPVAVHSVLGIGIRTTIGVPDRNLPVAATLIVVDAVTASSRTCVSGVAWAAAIDTQTREGIALCPALRIPRS